MSEAGDHLEGWVAALLFIIVLAGLLWWQVKD